MMNRPCFFMKDDLADREASGAASSDMSSLERKMLFASAGVSSSTKSPSCIAIYPLTIPLTTNRAKKSCQSDTVGGPDLGSGGFSLSGVSAICTLDIGCASGTSSGTSSSVDCCVLTLGTLAAAVPETVPFLARGLRRSGLFGATVGVGLSSTI